MNNLGAPPNLSAVQLASEFGLEFKTLALKTVPATMAGLLGGQVDVAVGQVASIHAYGDEVRPLIILDNDRQAYFEKDLPGVRTVGEAFPGKNANVWVHGGLAVRADTPQDIVDLIAACAYFAAVAQGFEAAGLLATSGLPSRFFPQLILAFTALCAAVVAYNRARMNYPTFRAMGLCVATGVVEGGCKHIVGTRLKRGGMRWTVAGANAIIALRCAVESNRFDDFWERRASATA